MAAVYGEDRREARSSRLRWYVVFNGSRSHSSLGAFASQRSSQVIARHGAGRFLDELNLLTRQRVFVSARVAEPGEVIAVPRDALRRLIATDARLSDKVFQEERLAAAHARLTEAVAKVATSEDWQRLLRISNSFHRYSPNKPVSPGGPRRRRTRRVVQHCNGSPRSTGVRAGSRARPLCGCTPRSGRSAATSTKRPAMRSSNAASPASGSSPSSTKASLAPHRTSRSNPSS